MPIHCTGLGKALGAYMSEEELRSLYRVRKLPRHNENTISSFRRLQEEFSRIRQLSYAFDDEEDEVGWRCLGAPVLDDEGRPIAAVSVAGTTQMIHADNIPRLAETLKSCTTAITCAVGYSKN
jgi:DNA-binding IclR family transcriptional regulator